MNEVETQTTYWEHELDHQQAEFMHRLEVQNGLGQAALKSMMLVNGGAIIGLLTFVGNRGKVADAVYLKASIGLFGAGLFLGLLAYFGAYFSQAQFMMVAGHRVENAHSRLAGGQAVETPTGHETWGMRALWLAIICLFASLLLFGSGAWAALNGIL